MNAMTHDLSKRTGLVAAIVATGLSGLWIEAGYADPTDLSPGPVDCTFLQDRVKCSDDGDTVLYCVNASQDYLVVDDDGSDADFPTIRQALNASADGEVIHVCPGFYEETIVITRDVILVSLAGAEDTIIYKSERPWTLGDFTVVQSRDGHVIEIKASATVDGFTIRGAPAIWKIFA